MPKILRPLDVYKHLPGTNCGKCGEINCMAFAAKLIERQVQLNNVHLFLNLNIKLNLKL